MDSTSLRQLLDLSTAVQYSTAMEVRKEIKELNDGIRDTKELLLNMADELSNLSRDLRSVSVTLKNARLGEARKGASKDLRTKMRGHLESFKGSRGKNNQ